MNNIDPLRITDISPGISSKEERIHGRSREASVKVNE